MLVEFQPITHVMHMHAQFQTLLRFYVKFHYRKRQESSKRKVSWFTAFHSVVGKTFAGLALSVLKESHCSNDSLGKLLCLVKSLQKLQKCSLAQLCHSWYFISHALS